MPRVRYLTDPFEVASRHAHLAEMFASGVCAALAPDVRPGAPTVRRAVLARRHARAASTALRAASRHETPDGAITIPSPAERPEIALRDVVR